MAVWEIAIEKVLNAEYWINVYHVNVADQAEAIASGNQIIGVERGITLDIVGFTKMRVRQASALAAPGTVIPIGLNGASATANYLPLFVVSRVDFAVAVGRPSRKYIKQPTPLGSVSNGQFSSAHIAFIQTNYVLPLLDVVGICASDGQEMLSGACMPAVGMRQLRRGSRKKETPIIE